MRWLRASASLPGVSRPVKIGDGEYLDGGLADSIPLEFMQKQGFEKNVIVLTRPEGYVKKQDGGTRFMTRFVRNYPNLVRTMLDRHIMYNDELEYVREEEKKGRVFVIRPEEALPVKKTEHNPKKLRIAYNIGRKTMLDQLEELKAFLKE